MKSRVFYENKNIPVKQFKAINWEKKKRITFKTAKMFYV